MISEIDGIVKDGGVVKGQRKLIMASVPQPCAAAEDPTYLTQPFTTSTHFKKEPNGSKWSPRVCEVTLPVEGK